MEHASSNSHNTGAPPDDFPWEGGWRAWLKTLWPLAAHLVLVFLITTFTVYYVDDNYFNLNDRLPWTSLTNANGERIRPTPLGCYSLDCPV
ncbi:hypothetical protein RSAG8_13476, partial [Rhizoctonia solani AG-8 WAC10335]